MYNRLIIGNRKHHLTKTNSTNSYTKAFIKNNLVAEGTVIIADEQTQGRGQYGNDWLSAKGENLTFSIVLFPKYLKATEQFLLSQAISLGTVHYLKTKTNLPISIKWPNDILIDTKKVCGILIENSLHSTHISESIVGIGLNVNQTEFSSEVKKATSLKITTAENYLLPKELELLLNYLDKFYLQLMQGRHHLLRKQYLQNLFRLNEKHFFMLNEEKIEGTIKDVSLSGQLEILIDHKLQRFNNKEIEFVY